MKTPVNAVLWTCDGCQKTEMVPVDPNYDGSGPPPVPVGWIDSKTEVETLDHPIKWQSHMGKCIPKAIAAAIASETEGGSAAPAKPVEPAGSQA